MKRLGFAIGLVFLLYASSALAQEEVWLVIGIQHGGLLGSGVAENHFDAGTGFLIEVGSIHDSGWAWTGFGTGAYWSKNWVGEDSADVRFYIPYYTEIRRFFKVHHGFIPFCSIGLVWDRMHFEGTEGADNQLLISTGLGAHIRLGKSGMILQAAIKPYAAFYNSIGGERLNKGIETHIAIGLRSE